MLPRLFDCCSPVAVDHATDDVDHATDGTRTLPVAVEAMANRGDSGAVKNTSDVEALCSTGELAILPGLTTNWRCRAWDVEWLRKTLGHHDVEVSHRDFCGNGVSRETVRLEHFLQSHADRSWVPDNTIPYVSNLDLFALAPELRAEVPSEALFGSDRTLVIHGAFLGAAGSSTRLHVDSEDNIIYCAFGRKLFILLPPLALDLIGARRACVCLYAMCGSDQPQLNSDTILS